MDELHVANDEVARVVPHLIKTIEAPGMVIVEVMADALHTYWVEEYRKAGFTSRLSSWGDEFMLPWEELSERSKDFDRRGILAAVRAMYSAGYRLDQPQEVIT